MKYFLLSFGVIVFSYISVNAQLTPSFEGWSQSDVTRWNDNQINQMYATMTTNSVDSGGTRGKSLTKEQIAAISVGRKRITSGQATTSFKPLTPRQLEALVNSPSLPCTTLAKKFFSVKELVGRIPEVAEKMQESGFSPNDVVDGQVYGAAVIYSQDFGTFPTKTELFSLRDKLKRTYLQGEWIQGAWQHFPANGYNGMVCAVVAEELGKRLDRTQNSTELETIVESLNLLENYFERQTMVSIYKFAGEVGRARQKRTGARFQQESRELARGWYEKEYARNVCQQSVF